MKVEFVKVWSMPGYCSEVLVYIGQSGVKKDDPWDHPFSMLAAFIFNTKKLHDNYIIGEPICVKKDIYGIIDLKIGKRIGSFL